MQLLYFGSQVQFLNTATMRKLNLNNFDPKQLDIYDRQFSSERANPPCCAYVIYGKFPVYLIVNSEKRSLFVLLTTFAFMPVLAFFSLL